MYTKEEHSNIVSHKQLKCREIEIVLDNLGISVTSKPSRLSLGVSNSSLDKNTRKTYMFTKWLQNRANNMVMKMYTQEKKTKKKKRPWIRKSLKGFDPKVVHSSQRGFG